MRKSIWCTSSITKINKTAFAGTFVTLDMSNSVIERMKTFRISEDIYQIKEELTEGNIDDLKHNQDCKNTISSLSSAQQPKKPVPPTRQLPRISRREVTNHSDATSCWIIINGKVCDVTEFITEHPGGEEILLEHAGWEATVAFKDVAHSREAIKLVEKYCIGILDEAEPDGRRKPRHDTV